MICRSQLSRLLSTRVTGIRNASAVPASADVQNDSTSSPNANRGRNAKNGTSSNTGASSGEANPAIVTTRRTKKAFAELPTSLVKNGAPAPPLSADWNQYTVVNSAPILIPSDSNILNKPLQASFPKTQLASEILENLIKFPHCLLFTHVGNFYESYFDQAFEVSKLLGIKLGSRAWGGQRVPMCGFPLAHLDRHLKRLVQTHKRFVAVCEEFKKRDGTFERRVVRVVTPGTLIDESFVNPFENNFLLAISTGKTASEQIGLAWMDVSTGEFLTQAITPENLVDELARISPKEVVLSNHLQADEEHPIRQALAEEPVAVSYLSSTSESSNSLDLPKRNPACEQSVFTESETQAISLLTAFLRGSLLEHMPQSGLLSPTHQTNESRMQIDSHTIKALEIRQEMREGGVTGSLMSVIKRTVTSGGTRLLERWLCSPSTSTPVIEKRQSLVTLFLSFPHFRQDMLQLLKQADDSIRIVQKFLLGKGDTDDLLAIKDTIQIWDKMRRLVVSESSTASSQEEWKAILSLMNNMGNFEKLASSIEAAVDENVHRQAESSEDEARELGEFGEEDAEEDFVAQAALGGNNVRAWTIKPLFSPQLLTLHRKLKRLHTDRDTLEQELRVKTGASSLILQATQFQGWQVRITKAKEAKALGDVTHLQLVELSKSGSSRTYFYAPWAALGASIMQTQAAIFDAERRAFMSLRNEVVSQTVALRRTARICDELDVTLSFAVLAEEMKFTRPVVDQSKVLEIVNGRHPTVELGLLRHGRNFVPNSVGMNEDSRLHVITGPNMAGKSTLLRQVAIISILAQIGSFVPADSVRIGVVDKCFSRIGAKDDLYRDRSTFMVEMLETAEILKKASDRSLVIMDEVGRGTTVKDGVAIAFATAHHLLDVSRCRSLFATHFHDIADMLGYGSTSKQAGVEFFCTDVDETEDGYFAYSHRMREGVNRDSHGLKVAQMAGLPDSVIQLARRTVHELEADGKATTTMTRNEKLRMVGEAVLR